MDWVTKFIEQLFVVAARKAALWPEPHRFQARDALRSLSLCVFEYFIRDGHN